MTHTTPIGPALVLALAGTASAAPPRAAPPPKAAACRAPAPSNGHRPFTAGEKSEYELSSLGVRIGTLRSEVQSDREGHTFVVKVDTGTFASTFRKVRATARAGVRKDLRSTEFHADSTEDGVNRTMTASFPPKRGRLEVRHTREGEPGGYRLAAPDDTLDLIAAIFRLRALDLKVGQEFCAPVFAQWRLWEVRGRVAAREKVLTPIGEFQTLRIDMKSVRKDDPKDRRDMHIWVTDDARRLPIGGFATAYGQPVQAMIVKAPSADGDAKR